MKWKTKPKNLSEIDSIRFDADKKQKQLFMMKSKIVRLEFELSSLKKKIHEFDFDNELFAESV